MKKITICVLLAASLCPPLAAQEDYPLLNSGKIIEQATLSSDSGHFKQAIALYDQVTRNDTNYVKALYRKALALEADSQINESIHFYDLALKLSDNNELAPDIYNNYANALNANGQTKRALDLYDSAIKKYPQYSLLYFNKGIAILNENSLPEE